MQFSKNAQACRQSPMRKFHPYAVQAKARGTKVYHLNIGQPDIETPQEYFDACKNFSEAVLEYAPSPGVPDLTEAIQRYYANIGVRYDAEDIFITSGGSEALQILMLCILDPGSEVIIPEPFYPNDDTFVKAAGGVIVPVYSAPEEGYHYADRARIEAAITDQTRAIVMINPGNPTGAVLTPDELAMMADIAKKHDILLIADEVYREFVYADEPLTSLGQIPGMEEHGVVVDSISKRFGACGARIGAIMTKNRQLQQEIIKFCQARLAVATLDQYAAAALYMVGDEYFAAVRAEYRQRRDICYQKLSAIPGVECKEPKGAFYMMATLPVDDADAFQVWLLESFSDNGETVMFAPGEGFYATPGKGKNEIRIAYVLKEKDLARAIDLLALGIEAYNREKQV